MMCSPYRPDATSTRLWCTYPMITPKNMYDLHAVKSTHTAQVTSRIEEAPKAVMLGLNRMTISHKFTHLGLEWEAGKSTPRVEPRITAARNAAISMLGIGMHVSLQCITRIRLYQLALRQACMRDPGSQVVSIGE